MHCSPIMRAVTMASWLITALAAINVGLLPFGYNVFDTDFFHNNLAKFIIPLHYIIGLAGIISLAVFVMMCSGHCYKCGCSGSECKCS